MRFLLADRWHWSWLAAWLAVAAVWVSQASLGWLEPAERWWLDRSLADARTPVSDNITLVAIDDASLRALGPWPWSRELHARLVDRLSEAGARLVIYTTPFIGAESQEALAQLQRIADAVATDPVLADHPQLSGLLQQSQSLLDADSRLAQSLAQNQRTVLATQTLAGGGQELPLAALSAAALGVGHFTFERDADGLVRRVDLRGHGETPNLTSLASWVAAAQVNTEPSRIAQSVRTPGEVPDRFVQPAWRSASAAAATLPHISAATLMSGQAPMAKLRNRIVLVGPTSPLLEQPLPVSRAGVLMPVQALAQAASALSTGHWVRQPAWVPWANAACLAGIALFVVFGLPRLAPSAAVALLVLLSVGLLCMSSVAAASFLIEWPVLTPILALWAGHAASLLVRRLASTRSNALHAAANAGQPAEPSPALVDRADIAPTQPSFLASMPSVDLAPIGRRTSGLALSSLPPLRTTTATPPSTPRVTRLPQLGGFQLDREIGRGAMGRVYLAHEIATARPVAIKTLALSRDFAGFALHEARTRFQREAMAALRLKHPDIVQVFDAGEDQGYAWIAMELLSGHDLVRHTQAAQRLPVPLVLDICARVADALSHAHAQGVVHRDIKPANVMIDPSQEMVKVTDFGIARITDAARTRTGLVLGSPSYMSPEQLAGRAVDGRSDVYSLGVLLFELLTGQLPMQGHSMAELMRAVAHTPAPDVRSLRPRLPEAVANVVTLALEKRPELRYPSAADLAADLREVALLWDHPPAKNNKSGAAPTSSRAWAMASAQTYFAALEPDLADDSLVHNGQH